jgi:predicted nucleic acid-binding protein
MYLLDTNTVIDFFNSKLPINAKELLAGIEPAISVITRIELYASAKMPEKERLALDEFVNMATVYDHINKDVVAQTIVIRQHYKIKLPDAVIAATALVYDLMLITRNTKDFVNIQGLQTIDPHSL